MSDLMKPCPICECPYGYALKDVVYVCPECNNNWNPEDIASPQMTIKDVNGNSLKDGDSVIVIKNLPVKGANGPIKAGTKVKNIRLADGDHNISCKISGFGAIGLKSEFVKKA